MIKYFSKCRFLNQCELAYAITSVPVSTRRDCHLDVYQLSPDFIIREVDGGSHTTILWLYEVSKELIM